MGSIMDFLRRLFGEKAPGVGGTPEGLAPELSPPAEDTAPPPTPPADAHPPLPPEETVSPTKRMDDEHTADPGLVPPGTEYTQVVRFPGQDMWISSTSGLLQQGDVLANRYRILGILGHGSGAGVLYHVRDLALPDVTREYAVKELKILGHFSSEDSFDQVYDAFWLEVEILSALRHPAIPRIHDYFSIGTRVCLVMEYIQGKDLESIMKHTDGLLPVEQVRGWAIEICDALHYLHTAPSVPIVYCDMKPSNVLIDSLDHVMLTDFVGIAKVLLLHQRGSRLAHGGRRYWPPEQYKGEVSPASDIYGLGATLHHVLTGVDPRMEPPFSFESRPIRDYNPDVPEAFAAIVMRALAHDPADRFATAEEMKQALEALDLG